MSRLRDVRDVLPPLSYFLLPFCLECNGGWRSGSCYETPDDYDPDDSGERGEVVGACRNYCRGTSNAWVRTAPDFSFVLPTFGRAKHFLAFKKPRKLSYFGGWVMADPLTVRSDGTGRILIARSVDQIRGAMWALSSAA